MIKHPAREPWALGVDVGTQGVRVAVVDSDGVVRARSRRDWGMDLHDHEVSEQDPELWRSELTDAIHEVLFVLGAGPASRIARMSVDATSGTLVMAGPEFRALRRAMMWNDGRGGRQAGRLREALETSPPLGIVAPVTSGFAAAKALWVMDNEPDVWSSTEHVLAAGDWINAQLCENRPVTDYTNALKLAYDLGAKAWPDAVSKVGISTRLLPTVLPAGTSLGEIDRAARTTLGLCSRPVLSLGMTDASASFVASGAMKGDLVTTLGTGMSIKALSEEPVSNREGALYSHLHWSHGWIASCTSTVGAGILGRAFPGADLNTLARSRAGRSSSVLVEPAGETGAICLGSPEDEADRLMGCLELIGFVELQTVRRMQAAGVEVSGLQLTCGGGASNDVWMQVRADILGRPVARTRHADSAFGSAIVGLAESPSDLDARIADSVKIEALFEPDAVRQEFYAARFEQWVTWTEQRRAERVARGGEAS